MLSTHPSARNFINDSDFFFKYNTIFLVFKSYSAVLRGKEWVNDFSEAYLNGGNFGLLGIQLYRKLLIYKSVSALSFVCPVRAEVDSKEEYKKLEGKRARPKNDW